MKNDLESRCKQLIAALKEHRFRLTPQRLELVRLIAASEGHPNARQLYEKIKSDYPTMSFATVYKTLALLKEMGQVLEIDLHNDSHYDGNRPEPHPHLICDRCGKITDADVSFEAESLRRLEQASGFKILRPQISFFGLCMDCQEADRIKEPL